MKTWAELSQEDPVSAEGAAALLARRERLQTFQAAREWEGEIQAVVDSLTRYRAECEIVKGNHCRRLAQFEEEQQKKSFAKRLFASGSDVAREKQAVAAIEQTTKQIQGIVEHLRQRLASTPANKAEQKSLLEHLRLRKKELSLQKREVNEGARQARTIARQKTSSVSGLSGRGLVGSYAKIQRQSARYDKERVLAPLEDAKKAIEAELIAVERDIAWVMRFHGDDGASQAGGPGGNQTMPAERICAYCGRKTDGIVEICPSCGALL